MHTMHRNQRVWHPWGTSLNCQLVWPSPLLSNPSFQWTKRALQATSQQLCRSKTKSKVVFDLKWLVVWLSWSRQSVAKVNCSFEHHHPSLLWATISTIHHHANASDCRALLFGVKIMFLIVFVMILWWRGWIRHFIIFKRTKNGIYQRIIVKPSLLIPGALCAEFNNKCFSLINQENIRLAALS